MKKVTEALLTLVLLVQGSAALAQGPPVCKGWRKGDPHCGKAAPPKQESTGSSGSGPIIGTPPVQKHLTYDLSLKRIGEGDVIEFTPIQIDWTLSVGAVGLVGPEPTPVDVDVCPAADAPPPNNTACGHVGQAAPGRTYHGRMTVPAPPAGEGSPLRMVVLTSVTKPEDFGQKTPVGEGSVPIVDVAARYDVAITGFDVLTTRSTFTDTIWISLSGLIKAVPPHPSDNEDACKTVGFTTWCIFNQNFGDAGDGMHTVKDVRVGPYDLVPERETDLRFVFYLDNHDHNPAQEIFVAVANGFSKAGMIILSGYGAASGNPGAGNFATQLDDAMEKMHSGMAASCDGPVAKDVVIVPNTTTVATLSQFTLDALTRGGGVFATTAPEIYREIDGDLRCDRRGGAYKVDYAVTRTSWRDWGFRPQY